MDIDQCTASSKMFRTGVLVLGAILLHQVVGHGFMSEPPERSSMWRYGFDTPVNYKDNGLDCGSFTVQWEQNNGACGACGDNYADPRPRPNENGGTYGLGVIAREYTQGQTIQVSINFTSTHAGWMEWRVCKLNSLDELEEESCFEQNILELSDGSGTRFYLDQDDNNHHGIYTTEVNLPVGLTCERCVLQWYYRDGNKWGDCGDGTSGMWCGKQQEFRNCADVSIS